ncbi:MAG TPA: hypothetical protein VIM01_10225 [Dermatophilaceae bacterium]
MSGFAFHAHPLRVVPLTTRTEYPVIAEPPLAGAVKRTSAEAFPAVGVGVAGVA